MLDQAPKTYNPTRSNPGSKTKDSVVIPREFRFNTGISEGCLLEWPTLLFDVICIKIIAYMIN